MDALKKKANISILLCEENKHYELLWDNSFVIDTKCIPN